MADPPCALDANGNLLDASKIVWFNDRDDIEPMITRPSTPSAGPSATSSTTITQAQLNWYLLPKGTRTAAIATGGRCSGRVSRPTKLAIDGGSLPKAKHVAIEQHTTDEAQVDDLFEAEADGVPDKIPRLMESSDEEDGEEEDGDEIDSEDQEAAYEKTKAFGDADREASVLFIFFVDVHMLIISRIGQEHY